SGGAAISGVGLQGHQKMEWPTAKQEADTIEAFAALGVKVHITELDVDVLPRTTQQNTADISATAAATANSNPYAAGLPNEQQQALAQPQPPVIPALRQRTRAPSPAPAP